MAKRRIFVSKVGDVTGLYDERFGNITAYGQRTITRASTVEFDNKSQMWDVRMPRYPGQVEELWTLAATAPTREEALAKEKLLVEAQMTKELQNG